MPLLEVKDLQVGFGSDPPVLAGLDLSIAAGETVALVGESGSGKSLTARSIVRLLPRGAHVTRGSIAFQGADVLAMPAERLNRLRGGGIAMLFQQPLAMLDPSATVGSQVAEAVTLHGTLRGTAVWARVLDLFREVGIAAPEARARAYPHQLSVGMAQRVMIAAALAGNPHLLIADEPTAALDVTVQLQILQLIAREREQRRLATLLITHDLGVVSALADRILVLYAGRVVEEGPRADILLRPQHPYTRALVRASLLNVEPDGTLFALTGALLRPAVASRGCAFLQRCATADALGLHATCARHQPALVRHGGEGNRVRCWAPGAAEAEALATSPVPHPREPGGPPAASLRAVSKHYALGRGATVRAVDAVSLEILQGETLGLVGESGCGKSTLARLLLRLTPVTSGAIQALGHDYQRMRPQDTAQLYRDAQLIFQDPFSALDPRMRLGESLSAPLLHNGRNTPASRKGAVLAMMQGVGLDAALFDRLPRECSGGELQRAVIARALLMGPRLLICDEPTSALDASIRAQILNLLQSLRDRHQLTMLLISHDLRVVRHVCDRVAVMYLGEIVELADTSAIFARPAHPYTQALIAASLLDEHGLASATGRVQGEPPNPLDPPPGCRFHTRCRISDARCRAEHPPLVDVQAGHAVRCWHWEMAAVDA